MLDNQFVHDPKEINQCLRGGEEQAILAAFREDLHK
jgi:hypothetical protein